MRAGKEGFMCLRTQRSQGMAGPSAAKGEPDMKNSDVQVGSTYLTKVGKRSVDVRIDSQNPKGGWNGIAVATNKPIRIKNAKNLQSTNGPTVDESDGNAAPAEPDLVPLTKLDKDRKRSGKSKKTSAPKVSKPKAEKKPAKEKAPKKPKAMSALDAAVEVLKAKGEPMNCRAMIDAMKEQKLWSSDAPTPHATLFSALLREINKKGSASRFKKADRGHFTLSSWK
jgi:hypothetical protein